MPILNLTCEALVVLGDAVGRMDYADDASEAVRIKVRDDINAALLRGASEGLYGPGRRTKRKTMETNAQRIGRMAAETIRDHNARLDWQIEDPAHGLAMLLGDLRLAALIFGWDFDKELAASADNLEAYAPADIQPLDYATVGEAPRSMPRAVPAVDTAIKDALENGVLSASRAIAEASQEFSTARGDVLRGTMRADEAKAALFDPYDLISDAPACEPRKVIPPAIDEDVAGEREEAFMNIRALVRKVTSAPLSHHATVQLARCITTLVDILDTPMQAARMPTLKPGEDIRLQPPSYSTRREKLISIHRDLRAMRENARMGGRMTVDELADVVEQIAYAVDDFFMSGRN